MPDDQFAELRAIASFRPAMESMPFHKQRLDLAALLADRDRLAQELETARGDAARFAGQVAGLELDRDQYRTQWENQCGVARLATEKLAEANADDEELLRELPGLRERINQSHAGFVAENARLRAALALARQAIAEMPASLGYEYTHLRAIDAALRAGHTP